MKIIAHRGASHDAPENTIPAIYQAWQERADGVEIDARVTADGKVVLIHDPDTHRTSGTKLEVKQQIWDAIRILDVGSWKNPRFRLTTIPLFRDVLKMLPGGRELWVEVKCGAEIIPALRNDLDVRRPPESGICFVGFNAQVMSEIKRAFPKYRAFLNVEPPGQRGAPTPWTAENLIDVARRMGLDGLSVGISDLVEESFIGEVHGAGLDLVGWVVDDEKTALRLAKAGLKALMTNRPQYLRQKLSAHGIR